MIVLEIINKVQELKESYDLTLWSKIQSDESVFMIKDGSKYVGYISYISATSTISKFEIVEPYRNKGIGKQSIQLFFNKIKPYTNKIIVAPITESLFEWYEQLGFKTLFLSEHKMMKKLKG